MISHDIQGLRTWLDLSLSAGQKLGATEITVLLRSLSNIHAQAVALEAAQVPRRQRITRDQLDSGRVTLFPVAARREAEAP